VTHDEKEAIRARHTDFNGLCEWCCCEWPCDAVALLAGVDRLTALNFAHNDEEHDCGTIAERARILAGVEGLDPPPHSENWGVLEDNGWYTAVEAVIAIVEGENDGRS
jgi:hypothetical protein